MKINSIFIRIILYFFIIALILTSCNQTSSNKANINTKLSICIEKDKIIIDGDTSLNYPLIIKVDDIIVFKDSIKGDSCLLFSELIKNNIEIQYELAYYLATNQGNLPIHFVISNIKDTTIIYDINVRDVTQYNTFVNRGKCAKLYSGYDVKYMESIIIKWLYRQHKADITDSLINNMCMYLKELNRTKYNEYTTNEEIPIVSSLKGLEYNITSDMLADNYYLFACAEERDIEEFVEEMISIKFEGATHSLNKSMSCFRKASTSGPTCIMLIGINNDWSYQILPIGLICIDDYNPSVRTISYYQRLFIEKNGSTSIDTYNYNPFQCTFDRNHIRVTSNKNISAYRGELRIDIGDFEGYEFAGYDIPFTFIWGGDVSKIIIKKSNSSRKSIDLTQKVSPLHITIDGIMLNFGDNYLPIEVYDTRGNMTKYDLKVSVERVKKEKSNINIENTIYN